MSFSPFNWIRDLFGIFLDRKTAKKTELEIEKLEEDHVRASRLIRTDITLEEIKQYDPKFVKLLAEAAKNELHAQTRMPPEADALDDVEFLEVFLVFRKKEDWDSPEIKALLSQH